MAAKAKVYRDRLGVYVGVLRGLPHVVAVGSTAEEARHSLLAALEDIGLTGGFAEPVTTEPDRKRRTGRAWHL